MTENKKCGYKFLKVLACHFVLIASDTLRLTAWLLKGSVLTSVICLSTNNSGERMPHLDGVLYTVLLKNKYPGRSKAF